MWTIEFITLLGVIVTIIVFAFEIWNGNQIRKLNLFADYTKRYQEIMLHIPEGIHRSDFNYNKLNVEQKDEILRYMRAYFDLCSEQLHLKKKIDKKVWMNWEEGMKSAFKKQAFSEAWTIVMASDSFYYKEFNKFVEPLLHSRTKQV